MTAAHLALAAPRLAPHFALHLALAALAAQAAGLALHAPHFAAVCLGPHLLGAQAAMTLPLNAAALTTAEASALDRVEESWFMKIS
ncbi:MAG: hypothetical protein HZC37_14010 [Burkholderiales bacterium]|nr:hypothetical protein [Burkholderiales bacterium]